MTTIAQPRLAPIDAIRYCAILFAIISTAIAGTFGGLPFLLMALAALLTVRVYCHSEEAIVAGPMFLVAANVFLPSSARFGPDAPHPTEIIYWAAGSLPITLAGISKTGLKPFYKLPRSLQAFAAVAIIASAFGLLRGNDPSYVVRQLYGSLLFATYFALALTSGSEKDFARGLKTYGIPCVLAFVVYYIAVFNEFGLHREITTLGTQTIMLAIFFAIHKHRGYRAAAVLMLVPSLLLVVRRDLAACTLAATLFLALRAGTSRVLRMCAWGMAVAIVVVSLVPTYVAVVLDTATNTRIFDQLLPEGGRDNNSIEDRAMQLVGAAVVISRSPLLGLGMGGALEFESVQGGSMNGTYVDNGWAYLLTKMGMLGLATFAWFAFNMLRCVPLSSTALSAVFLTVLLLVMFAEPVCFQFTTSPLIGAITGLMYFQTRNPIRA